MHTRLLRRLLDGVACARCGELPTWRVGQATKRANSVTAVVRCSGCGGSFFLKCPASTEGDAQRQAAQEEFEAARRVCDAFPSSAQYAVATPARLVREKGLIFFEHIDGRDAYSVLLEQAPEQRIDLMERLGAWLRLFHAATGESEGPADLRERFAALTARSARNRPRAQAFDRVLERLQADLPWADSGSFRQAGLHGDCKAGNCLVRGAQIIGIDIAWKHRNMVEYDIAQFLAQLAVSSHGFRGRRLLPALRQLEAAFLRGYGGADRKSMRMIGWLKRYYYLSYWLSWREHGVLQRTWWDHFFERFCRVGCRGRDA